MDGSGPKKSPRRSRRITPIGKAMKSQDGGFSLFKKSDIVSPYIKSDSNVFVSS